jgi:hypothetical protein
MGALLCICCGPVFLWKTCMASTLISAGPHARHPPAGEDLDVAERLRNARNTAEALATGAARLSWALLGALAGLGSSVSAGTPGAAGEGAGSGTSSAPLRVVRASLLDALLQLHAQLCTTPECSAAVQGLMRDPAPLVVARQHVAAALGVWVDAGWQPSVIQAALGMHPAGAAGRLDFDPVSLEPSLSDAAGGAGGGKAAAGKKDPVSSMLAPSEAYAAASVLGDLLPPEWPPQPPPAVMSGAATVAAPASTAPSKGSSKSDKSSSKGSGDKAAAGGSTGAAGPPGVPLSTLLPPPAMPARRAAVLPGLVECESQLRRLLSMAALSESRLLRCMAARVAAKAAGLGPAMAAFCVQPLLEPLTVGGWLGGMVMAGVPACDY